MLSILQRMYDLTPNNPVTITEPVTVVCSDINDIIPIGGEYLRHAFIVLQDVDITVKDALGNTIKRGTDYFTIARASDSAYSKQYSTSIYSGLKFKATGIYTVSSFISIGTYPRAGWFNYLFDQFLTLRDVTVASLSTAVSTMRSDLNNMISTVQSTASSLSSLKSLFDTHAADNTIHITSAERAAWNNKTNTYFVATIAERDALTGLKTGDRVVVWNDGDSKRAVYFYGGTSTWYKDSDPDWENISLLWSALSEIPANVSAVVSAAGVTATATAGAVALWDASGKLKSVTPVDADANQTVATIEYVKSKVTSAGGGNLSTSDTSSTDGEIVVTDGTSGKLHKKSGTLLSSIMTAITNLQNLFTGGSAKSSLVAFYATYSGAHPITDLFISLPIGVSSINVVYNASADQYPISEVQNYIFDCSVSIIYTQKTTIYTAKLVNSQVDKRSWTGTYLKVDASEVWSGWIQLTDANGNAMTANNALSFGGNLFSSLFDASGYALRSESIIDTASGLYAKMKIGQFTASGATASIYFTAAFASAIHYTYCQRWDGTYLQNTSIVAIGYGASRIDCTGLTSGYIYRWVAIGY